jgi:hypothetical protein
MGEVLTQVTGSRSTLSIDDLTRLLTALSEGLIAIRLTQERHAPDVRRLTERIMPHLLPGLTTST